MVWVPNPQEGNFGALWEVGRMGQDNRGHTLLMKKCSYNGSGPCNVEVLLLFFQGEPGSRGQPGEQVSRKNSLSSKVYLSV